MVAAPEHRTVSYDIYNELVTWRTLDMLACDLIGYERGYVLELLRGYLVTHHGPTYSDIPSTMDFADQDNIDEWDHILGEFGTDLIEEIFVQVPGIFAVWGRFDDSTERIVVILVRQTDSDAALTALINRGVRR